MPATNNPAIGDMTCGSCGGAATVHQQSRGKRALYTKCTKCGVDQRNGAAVQQMIWAGSTWRDGEPERPGNLAADWSPSAPAPAAKPAGKPAADQPAEKPAAAKSGGAGLAIGGAGLAAVAAAVWLASKRTKTTTKAAAAAPATGGGRLDERYY